VQHSEEKRTDVNLPAIESRRFKEWNPLEYQAKENNTIAINHISKQENQRKLPSYH